uniref:GPN-loop GTPase n=1 Tax=Ascaris suum TaxID=6253 RepID=F1LAC7_ASCSU
MAEASSSKTFPADSLPCIVVLGMAGSGKSSFVQRLTARLHEKKLVPYVVNLDPAVNTLPYPANIDIRDTVKYKEVMREYGLGPNGAILTCLNLMCTRFEQVLELLSKRAGMCSHCLIDTPGQIEAFTWSASGSIITDAIASAHPTMVAYVMDSVRATNPITFMSNMLYACSIFYRTKLPFVVVLNKADIVRPTFAVKWMKDFESFQEALDENCSTYMNDLTRSLSLVLDQFYEAFSAVPVSSLTGEGIDEFLKQTEKCVKEYNDVYRPMYEQLANEKMKQEAEQNAEKLEKLKLEEKELVDMNLREPGNVFEKIHIGGVDEENAEDSNIQH